MADETIVIVGAGMTGAKAAEALRESGSESRIVMVGNESVKPYERPPLSKEMLMGKQDDPTWVLDDSWYADNNVELLTGRTVSIVRPDDRQVLLEGGDPITWDKLLFATGAEPRRINIPGKELDGVHYLRDLASSAALKARIDDGKANVVVVGGGWIGCEVASAARQYGCNVTVVEPAEVPLQRVLGNQLGSFYQSVHEDNGTRFLTGTGVEAFEGDGSITGVRLSTGETLPADIAVVGIGVVPRTSLAEEMGVKCDNGILTNAALETNIPGVYAAGDVANAWHPFYNRNLRVEHWANALRQGPAAGRSMAGEEVSYEAIPYFFSDQYDVGMEYVGFASGDDEVVIRGDLEKREFIAFWLQDDRIAAGMNVNVWDVSDPIRDLIRDGVKVNRQALADPDTDLSSLRP